MRKMGAGHSEQWLRVFRPCIIRRTKFSQHCRRTGPLQLLSGFEPINGSHEDFAVPVESELGYGFPSGILVVFSRLSLSKQLINF
jgi:hypothetical protein